MLLTSEDQLASLLTPILEGRTNFAAFDTETTEVADDRFTPWGTTTRIAGFSVSYDWEAGPVDFYCPIRHVPYDWRRKPESLAKVDEGAWIKRLTLEEGVLQTGGWAPGMDPNLPIHACLALLAEALTHSPGVIWGAHDWRFDASMLLADGIEPPWDRFYDSKLVNVFTDPRPLDRFDEEKNRYFHSGHGLKDLGEVWLNRPASEKTLLDLSREVLKCNDWSMLPLRTIVSPYACQDTRLVAGLREHQMKRGAYLDERVQELIRKHTAEIRTAIGMERLGIIVDCAAAEVCSTQTAAEVAEIQRKAEKLAGCTIPFNNGEELSNLLYGRLGLPQYRDQRNTRKATLKQVRQRLLKLPETYLASGMPTKDAAALITYIQDYRKAEKELTSFYRPLTYFGAGGEIHTILKPLEAKTTRYSASKPNVQQMPRKGDVRKLFRPRDGHVFVIADYATQELRVAAHYALAIPEAFEYLFTWRCTLKKRGDCKGRGEHGPGIVHTGWRENWSRRPERMGLVEGFQSGDRKFDPHQAMIDTCRSKGYAHVDRGLAKGANFSLIYGAGPPKLSETLDVDLAFAKELHNIFWEVAYPELGRVKIFIDERLRRAGKKTDWSHQEFIRTLHGGHIYLDSGYYGLNYIVQRSCREILLNALTELPNYLVQAKLPYNLLLPVHDELILEAPKDSVDQAAVQGIARIMVEAGAASLVPMIVDPSIAEVSWGEKSALPAEWGYNGVTKE